MNSTINKTFYTCSTESMFLRYKKISKKALKIGGFLQCWIHIFLRHDGCSWKIDLRILWNNVMKNFQVKHGQCESIIFISNFTKGQTFSFFMATKCSWGLCHNAAPLLALQKTPKKAFLSSLVWPRREYTWKVSWNES